MSGTITTGNSCSLRYWKITGTITGAVNTTMTLSYPTGCSFANIVAVYGTFNYGTYIMPFNNTYFQLAGNQINNVCLYIDTSAINIVIMSGAINVVGSAYSIIIVTSS